MTFLISALFRVPAYDSNIKDNKEEESDDEPVPSNSMMDKEDLWDWDINLDSNLLLSVITKSDPVLRPRIIRYAPDHITSPMTLGPICIGPV
jgi:hypothetical protein